MAPPRKKVTVGQTTKDVQGTWTMLITFVKNAIFDPERIYIAMCLLLVAEVILNVAIIKFVSYTEIDWIAYMQEVEGVLNGTYDYSLLKGDTGPLVYPAGFVYIFMGLYYITSQGQNILLAQYIYVVFYIVNLMLVFNIYRKVCKLPPWALVFMCCLSYRIHSIFVLRLFNDPIAMILLYAAINCFLYDHWLFGCIMYSVAVSVKMNIVLFAPGLLILLLRRNGLFKTILLLAVCAVVQVALGAPFLIENPVNYMVGAFNLGRQFLFKWTVNWRFLPVEVFTSRYFHVSLLAVHVATLFVFYWIDWSQLYKISDLFKVNTQTNNISSNDIVRLMFVSNFIGMCFSRSLHYQFYIWYFHTLHYLVWMINMPSVYRVLILGAIELCWNTYPSTIFSSGALHGLHSVILLGLLLSYPTSSTKSQKTQ